MNFCGEDKRYTDTPLQFDPLGRSANGASASTPTGGPEARNTLFNTLFGNRPGLNGTPKTGSATPGLMDQWMQNGTQVENRLRDAANDPIWGQVQQNARNTAAGNYLGGDSNFNNALSQFQQRVGGQNNVTAKTMGGGYLNPTQIGGGPAKMSDTSMRTLSGSFLNSAPQMRENTDQMSAGIRQRANAEAADQSAGIKSQFNRAGMGFSTANQQAQQSAGAAERARANELDAATRLSARQEADRQKIASYMAERGFQNDTAGRADSMSQNERNLKAQNYMAERGIQANTAGTEQSAARQGALAEMDARLKNYGTERAYQQGAGTQAEQANNAPINYLNAIPNAKMGTMQQIAQLVQGLSGGGSIATPNSTIVRQPGVYDYALQTLGAVSGAAGGGF